MTRGSLVEGDPSLLEVRNLRVVSTSSEGRPVTLVDGLSLSVGKGEILGLVGESGSGKTITARAIVGLTPAPARIVDGQVLFEGESLLALPESGRRSYRGARIGSVFQEPLSALNPVLTIGYQIGEAIRAHQSFDRTQVELEKLRLLELVASTEPRRILSSYPHQLSGGQLQRAMIAIALAAGPELLIADEPTSALDVTIQAQILELMERLRDERGLSVLLITHDLAIVAQTCDRVSVIYAGRVVEEATVQELFEHASHPYTRALLAALPQLGSPAPRGQLPTIPGRVPEPDQLPTGCAFHPRCPEVLGLCSQQEPLMQRVESACGERRHQARCWLLNSEDRGEPGPVPTELRG